MKRTYKYLLLMAFYMSAFPFMLSANKAYGNQEKVYPYLSDILDIYCGYYLSGPHNIQELKEFTYLLHRNFPQIIVYYDVLLTKTFPMLEKEERELEFEQTNCGFSLKHNSVLLFTSGHFPCCEEEIVYEEEAHVLLLRKVRDSLYTFDKRGKAVLKPLNLKEAIWKKKKKIYSRYGMNLNKDVLVFLEYETADATLNTYCKEEIMKRDSPYFHDIEKMAKTFCHKHKLSRLLFYTYKEKM